MKKVVVAFLAGALLMVSVQAFGSSVSQIGKKIQTEYTVTIDGQKLTVPAIAVDGKSYAPVRAIGDATGYDVSVSGKDITLKRGDSTVSSSTEPTVTSQPTLTGDQIKSLVSLNSKIATTAGSIGFTEAQLKDKPGDPDLTAKLDQYKAEYADLLAQKAELEQEVLNEG